MNRNKSLNVSNARLAMVIFLMAEATFFSGLITAYVILRAGAPDGWPPPGQPRLPIGISTMNTMVLLASGLLLFLALRRPERTKSLLAGATALGTLFLFVQGYEWVRLIAFGMKTTQSLYAGTFYAIVGIHGLHVLGGLLGLSSAVVASRKTLHPVVPEPLKVCGLYWFFVVGVWPLLYGLVYF